MPGPKSCPPCLRAGPETLSAYAEKRASIFQRVLFALVAIAAPTCESGQLRVPSSDLLRQRGRTKS